MLGLVTHTTEIRACAFAFAIALDFILQLALSRTRESLEVQVMESWNYPAL